MNRHLLTIALASQLVAGCATHRFHAHVANERWTEAAGAFAADSSLLGDADALLAAALLFGTPGRPTYDPARARELLRRLVAHHPRSAPAREAAALIPLLEQVLALREELRQLKEIDFRPPSRSP